MLRSQLSSNIRVTPYNLERLKATLGKHGVDLVVASSSQNVQYFSGFAPVSKVLNPNRSECYALLRSSSLDRVSIVHSVGESDQLLDMTATLEIPWLFGTFYRSQPSTNTLKPDEERLLEFGPAIASTGTEALVMAVQDAIRGLSTPRVLIDDEDIPSAVKAQLSKKCPNVIFVDGSNILRDVRAVKTRTEIKLLTEAAQHNEAAVQRCLDSARLDLSETDLAHLFETELVMRGSRAQATMIKVGRHAVTGQRRPNPSHRLQLNDVIWFDSDTSYQGYWSDIARTGILGEANALQVQRYTALRAGMDAGLNALVPGRTCAEVFEIVVSTVREAGLPEYQRHHVGHGIGLEGYEGTILAPNDHTIIESGMVISLETPFYEYGFGALHIEDPVLITETSGQFLTRNPNPELTIVPLEGA